MYIENHLFIKYLKDFFIIYSGQNLPYLKYLINTETFSHHSLSHHVDIITYREGFNFYCFMIVAYDEYCNNKIKDFFTKITKYDISKYLTNSMILFFKDTKLYIETRNKKINNLYIEKINKKDNFILKLYKECHIKIEDICFCIPKMNFYCRRCGLDRFDTLKNKRIH